MTSAADLATLAAELRASRGLAAKADIAAAAAALGVGGASAVPVGDDCAALPDGDGHLLFAIEGFMNEFVASDPWFAGWCGVMVNVSDILAMGGRPVAVVDALWSDGEAAAAPVLAGMRAAAEAYGVPIVGGHTNSRSAQGQLSVAILGRAKRLLTSFDARRSERLIAAIDLSGRYREPFDNFEAATGTAPGRLRRMMEILPGIAEDGLSRAAKDISQAGLVGTAAMLAECSGVGVVIDVAAVPRPQGVPLVRWLKSFPSFGFLLTAREEAVAAIIARFAAEGVAAADIGAVTADRCVTVTLSGAAETIRDLAATPLLGCGPPLDTPVHPIRESAA